MLKNTICIILFLSAFVSNTHTKFIKVIEITGDTPWVISEADYERIPIQMAIRDAEKDWYKVLGIDPLYVLQTMLLKNNLK